MKKPYIILEGKRRAYLVGHQNIFSQPIMELDYKEALLMSRFEHITVVLSNTVISLAELGRLDLSNIIMPVYMNDKNGNWVTATTMCIAEDTVIINSIGANFNDTIKWLDVIENNNTMKEDYYRVTETAVFTLLENSDKIEMMGVSINETNIISIKTVKDGTTDKYKTKHLTEDIKDNRLIYYHPIAERISNELECGCMLRVFINRER